MTELEQALELLEVETMEEAFEDPEIHKTLIDSVVPATDGCDVEPDGICPHGHRSIVQILFENA